MEKYILFLSVFFSLTVHVFLLSLFKVSSPIQHFSIPKMTRVSFFPLNVSCLNPYEQHSPQKKAKRWNDQSEKTKKKDKPFFEKTFYHSSSNSIQKIAPPKKTKDSIKDSPEMDYDLQTQRKLIQMFYPSYPFWAKRERLQVDVVIKFQILKNGQVGELFFEKMSGYPEMDVLALRALRRWKFESLPENVHQDLQWGAVTLKFRLNS